MGTLLRGKCRNCAYETDTLLFGSGFKNLKTNCRYPVMNKITEVVDVANIMDREEVIRQNPHIVFYDYLKLSDNAA